MTEVLIAVEATIVACLCAYALQGATRRERVLFLAGIAVMALVVFYCAVSV